MSTCAQSRAISSRNTWRDHGDRNDTRSISMTASRSEAFIGSIRNGWGALLSAMNPDHLTLCVRRRLRKRGTARDRGGGAQDGRPQGGDPLPRLARDQQRRDAAAAPAAPEERPGALAQHAPLAGRQLVDLREHELRRDVLRAEPLVKLALLVLDASAGVDQDHEQAQRRAPARVALDQA